MIEIKSFPPPIYRLDKVNSYMISKLHNYLTKSKEISKSVFDKDIFTEIFIKDEIEQSNKELLEVGTKDRQSRIEPLTMGFDRSIYGYSKDPELIELEKQFYKFYIISLKKHLKTVKRISPTAKQNGSVNPDEVKKPLNAKPIKSKKEIQDFFNADVEIKTIENIQKEFKDCIGKKMAFLIYLLETDLKLITYSLNGKNDSRKHFVESLINKTIKMQGINKHFESNAMKLNIFQFEKDNDYISTKEKLSNAIK